MELFSRFSVLLFAGFIWACSGHASPSPSLLIGTGIYDITGPAAEIDMMGYAKPSQLDNGLHSRLWARAFIFASPSTNKRVVFVSADLGMLFQSIKQGVIKKLHEKFGDKYTDQNVMLSATHTHAGPGGYAFHTLFNFTIRGFYKENYEVIVNGIVNAIDKADKNLTPAKAYLANTLLTNSAQNRSISAYLQNPPEERARYQYDTDKTMTQLSIFSAQGSPLGLINWHAVHGVSMSNSNKLISGDNKGYASYLFEKEMGSNYLSDSPFVAAFAQANEGDASPNRFGYHPNGKCDHFDCHDVKHTMVIGKRQFEKAQQLFKDKNTPLDDDIDFRHQYINMAHHNISPEFANGQFAAQTCDAALGYAFGAGTSDGPGMDNIFHPGQVKKNKLVNILRDFIAKPTKEMEQCQAPKNILLAVGLNKPAWVPHNMPIQLFKIGQLLIAGVPGEFTTMAGRRIKQQLKEAYGQSIQHVVIAGLSNSYAGYVTTREEYLKQNYEGGFTVFGQWALAAYQQGFAQLAYDMIHHLATKPGPQPEDLSHHTGSYIAPVLFDDKLPTKKFGSVHQQPELVYHPGDVAHAAFWAGHPRNNFETMVGFLEIQKLEGEKWTTIAHDWDYNTIYHWQRVGISYAYGHVFWHIPNDVPLGNYRIVHHGHYKYGWNQKIYPYQGISRQFEVIA